MELKVYKNLDEYINDTMHLLSKHEIQNNLIIGNCLRAQKNNWDISNYLLACVKENNEIKTIAMMTPPFCLLIYEVDNIQNDDALAYLVDYLINNSIKIPGVITIKELASRFISMYKKQINFEIKKTMNLRIYRLDEVKMPESKGMLRKATENDLYYLPYWLNQFYIDCKFDEIGTINDIALKTKDMIEKGNVYIYEDGYPVSQVASNRRTANGAVISAVFTPSYLRKKGYASSSVALYSQKLLDEGYKYCALFADLANPISNSIYQKIGYYPICDYDEIRFNYV